MERGESWPHLELDLGMTQGLDITYLSEVEKIHLSVINLYDS